MPSSTSAGSSARANRKNAWPVWASWPMKAKATTALETVARYSAERPLLSAMVAERAVCRVKCSVVRACSSCRRRSASSTWGCSGMAGATGGTARVPRAPALTVAVIIPPFISYEISVTPSLRRGCEHRPCQVVKGAAHAVGERLDVGAGGLVGHGGEVELAGVGQHPDIQRHVAQDRRHREQLQQPRAGQVQRHRWARDVG